MPRWNSDAWAKNNKDFKGPPPADHERRCKANRRRERERCKKWALKGSDYCQFHGGRRRVIRRNTMSKRYAKFLGETLRDKIEELASVPHHEQVSLYDEIAVARLAAVQALKLAEPVLNGEVNVKAEVKALAIECLREAMNHVRDMVVSAAKVETASGSKVSLRVVDLLIMQVIKAIHDVCPDKDVADKIAEHIRDNVRLPTGETSDVGAPSIIDGVESTPDMMVLEMDESVCGDEP